MLMTPVCPAHQTRTQTQHKWRNWNLKACKSQLVIYPPKQHLEGQWFHNGGDAEMADAEMATFKQLQM
jgi:hypothetical protein